MSQSLDTSSFSELVAGMLGILHVVEALAAHPDALEKLTESTNKEHTAVTGRYHAFHGTLPIMTPRRSTYKNSSRQQIPARSMVSSLPS